MFSAIKTAATPYMLYIKLAAVALMVGAAGYLAWDYRGRIAETEKLKAVAEAVEEAQKEVNKERDLRNEYQSKVDARMEELSKSVASTRAEFSAMRRDLAQDMKDNPDPYKAPVPAKGYEAWMNARNKARSAGQ